MVRDAGYVVSSSQRPERRLPRIAKEDWINLLEYICILRNWGLFRSARGHDDR